jgi:S-adenosylmethionine:tRNA ribosyltransferase-isomerase
MRQPNQSAQQTTNDLDRYQTIYANAPGAVAAPTAGLHFTEEIFAELKNKGVQIQYLTLHVGPGTFKPISSSVDDHTVESEEFQISKDAADAINKCRAKGGRVFAVGTTSCRSLETAGASGSLEAVESESTSLYIKPGHKFSMVDALITNFHLSRSSLLVLVSAFGGHDFIMRAYHQAIEQRYRFYSYGDAMLIL